MTVTITVPVAMRTFPGHIEPQFPAGRWFVQGIVQGDASGGQRTLVMPLATVSGARQGLMFSLESVWCRDTDNNNKIGQLSSTGLDDFRGELVSRHMIVGLTAAVNQSVLTPGNVFDFKAKWLGSQRGGAAAGILQLQFDNVNGATVTCFIEGYWWLPRSRGINGGPQRPATAFFPG